MEIKKTYVFYHANKLNEIPLMFLSGEKNIKKEMK